MTDSVNWRGFLLQYGHLACMVLDSWGSAVDATMGLPDMPAPNAQLLPMSHRDFSRLWHSQSVRGMYQWHLDYFRSAWRRQ